MCPMKSIHLPLLLVLTAAISPASIHAESPNPPTVKEEAKEPKSIDPKKREIILKLLEVADTKNMTQLMLDSMIEPLTAQIGRANPNLPAEELDKLRKSYQAEELIEIIVPLYDKHYTQEELEGLVAFYQTPLGKKFIKTLPVLTNESMKLGEEWGRKKSVEWTDEMRKKGYLKK